eukprot:gene11124-7750_t
MVKRSYCALLISAYPKKKSDNNRFNSFNSEEINVPKISVSILICINPCGFFVVFPHLSLLDHQTTRTGQENNNSIYIKDVQHSSCFKMLL